MALRVKHLGSTWHKGHSYGSSGWPHSLTEPGKIQSAGLLRNFALTPRSLQELPLLDCSLRQWLVIPSLATRSQVHWQGTISEGCPFPLLCMDSPDCQGLGTAHLER